MTIKQIGASVRKARGQRSISEVAEAAGLERHQVTGIEQAKKERKKTTNVELAAVRPCGGFVLRGALRQACVVRRLFIL